MINGYSTHEPLYVRLLNNSVLHFVPFTDNFDYMYTQYNRNQSVCDPTTQSNNEFADRLMSPESDKKKTLFLNMLETNQFDLALSFSAGGYDIQGPHTDNLNSDSMYTQSAIEIAKNRLRESHDECALDLLRKHQSNLVDRISEFLLTKYQLPMYTLQVSCCKMPPEKKIAEIWREAIHKTLNFLKLTETGVRGSVRNSQSTPLRKSVVSIIDKGITKAVTKNMAFFRFVLPPGQYELQINSTDAGVQTLPINLVN